MSTRHAAPRATARKGAARSSGAMVASTAALVALSSLLAARPATAEPPAVKASLTRLARALRCKGARDLEGFKVWCLTTRFLSAGRRPAVGAGLFYGMTVKLPKGKDPAQMVLGNISPSALVLRADGGKLRGNLFSLKASDPSERRMLVAATMLVTTRLKRRRGGAVKLAKPLAGYIKVMRRKAKHRVERRARTLVLHGASAGYVRRVGRAFIVVEVPKRGSGVFVSLLSRVAPR